MRAAFLTVTDEEYFAGTLAAVSSVRLFHPDRPVHVVANPKKALRPPQREHLESLRGVVVHDAAEVAGPDRHVNGWELKAYLAERLAADHDVLVGFDSDLVLCGSVDDVVERCHDEQVWQGGRDGDGMRYGVEYSVYGMKTPAANPVYISTSLYTVPCTGANRRVLGRWSSCCSEAVFNGRGPHPGHGDQGVLNALLYAEGKTAETVPLENALWSQHKRYWRSHFVLDESGRFVNQSSGGLVQRAFHSVDGPKFWDRAHREHVLHEHGAQTWPYVWFLAMLWFGPARCWGTAPGEWLPGGSKHLPNDLANFFPQIAEAYPPAVRLWDAAPPALVDAAKGSGARIVPWRSLHHLRRVVRRHPAPRRVVEVGGYEGGSALTLALLLLNRDADVFAVESFAGNAGDGTVDGYPTPGRAVYEGIAARLPGVRLRLVPGQSPEAAGRFADGSLDLVFLDGCHATNAVAADIAAWGPKLAPGGILCGDDYDRADVRAAVDAAFPRVEVEPGGVVWWTPGPAAAPPRRSPASVRFVGDGGRPDPPGDGRAAVRTAFFTVTERSFFAGTLAALSSVRLFHPGAAVHVVANPARPLTESQKSVLRGLDWLSVEEPAAVSPLGFHVEAKELKAYLALDLAEKYDVVVGFDSDLVLCGPAHDVVRRAHETGGWVGGRDGTVWRYGEEHAVYGIDVPAENAAYMSTSFYAVACTNRNRDVLRRWTECVNAAQFNGRGPYPGYGDQPVLNAILFAAGRTGDVGLLENPLWSQHQDAFWGGRHALRDGRLVNLTCGGKPQRAFHTPSVPKCWQREFRDRLWNRHGPQQWPYVWFLAMLWFGPARCWDRNPGEWLPEGAERLADDLVNCFSQIVLAYPEAGPLWEEVPDTLLAGLRRSPGGHAEARSRRLIDRLAGRRPPHRLAVCGPGGAGTALSTALRLLNRDADVYLVESFADRRSGDAGRATRAEVTEEFARLGGGRVRLIGAEPLAAEPPFDDGSLDGVFFAGAAAGPGRGLDAWSRKIVRGGFAAGGRGDDFWLTNV